MFLLFSYFKFIQIYLIASVVACCCCFFLLVLLVLLVDLIIVHILVLVLVWSIILKEQQLSERLILAKYFVDFLLESVPFPKKTVRPPSWSSMFFGKNTLRKIMEIVVTVEDSACEANKFGNLRRFVFFCF